MSLNAGVGAIVFDGQGRIALLLRRVQPERGCWTLPGGATGTDESVVEAVRRELREELAIEVKPTDCLGIIDLLDAGRGDRWLSFVFIVEIVSGSPRNAEPTRHTRLAWFPPHKVPSPLTILTAHAVSFLTTFAPTALPRVILKGIFPVVREKKRKPHRDEPKG
jgi:ADP-ribose pyrophosphatase YjhB (NUDIX family)